MQMPRETNMTKTIYRFMVLIYAVDVSVHKELGQPGPGPAWASQQRQAGFYLPPILTAGLIIEEYRHFTHVVG